MGIELSSTLTWLMRLEKWWLCKSERLTDCMQFMYSSLKWIVTVHSLMPTCYLSKIYQMAVLKYLSTAEADMNKFSTMVLRSFTIGSIHTLLLYLITKNAPMWYQCLESGPIFEVCIVQHIKLHQYCSIQLISKHSRKLKWQLGELGQFPVGWAELQVERAGLQWWSCSNGYDLSLSFTLNVIQFNILYWHGKHMFTLL